MKDTKLSMVKGDTLAGLVCGISPLVGAVVGLAASGYTTIAQNVGY